MKTENEKYVIIKLSKKYASIYGVPVIDRFETSIYKIRYFTYCLSCDFCHDSCCFKGADVDLDNVQRIMKYANEIEDYIKIPRNEWFAGEYKYDPEFPSGHYTRTKIKNGACVFLNRNGRGCMLHKFCVENKIDFHTLKPMVCSLFPLTFDEGLLHPSNEVLDNSLICLHQGPSLYRGVREELIYYFGKELVDELDYYESIYG